MKHKGATVTLTVTVPKNRKRLAQIERLMRYAVDGYECSTVENLNGYRNPQKPETIAKRKAKKEADIEAIRVVATELDVLKRTREDKIVVIRTSLVYYLLKHFNALTIAQAFGWDHATVNACVKRYESLKHYPDYGVASVTVTQCLTRYSLADYPPLPL